MNQAGNNNTNPCGIKQTYIRGYLAQWHPGSPATRLRAADGSWCWCCGREKGHGGLMLQTTPPPLTCHQLPLLNSMMCGPFRSFLTQQGWTRIHRPPTLSLFEQKYAFVQYTCDGFHYQCSSLSVLHKIMRRET